MKNKKVDVFGTQCTFCVTVRTVHVVQLCKSILGIVMYTLLGSFLHRHNDY